jgi:hypothetical protein
MSPAQTLQQKMYFFWQAVARKTCSDTDVGRLGLHNILKRMLIQILPWHLSQRMNFARTRFIVCVRLPQTPYISKSAHSVVANAGRGQPHVALFETRLRGGAFPTRVIPKMDTPEAMHIGGAHPKEARPYDFPSLFLFD